MDSLKNLFSIHLIEDIFLVTSTVLSITSISIFTGAVVASFGVSTSSINITAVGLGFAFVYI